MEEVSVIYFGHKKAFDMVDHTILLVKLYEWIRSIAYNWFKKTTVC